MLYKNVNRCSVKIRKIQGKAPVRESLYKNIASLSLQLYREETPVGTLPRKLG